MSLIMTSVQDIVDGSGISRYLVTKALNQAGVAIGNGKGKTPLEEKQVSKVEASLKVDLHKAIHKAEESRNASVKKPQAKKPKAIAKVVAAKPKAKKPTKGTAPVASKPKASKPKAKLAAKPQAKSPVAAKPKATAPVMAKKPLKPQAVAPTSVLQDTDGLVH